MNIIKLAKQAGLRTYQEQAPGIDGVYGNWEDLENFAHLVAAAARADEREECAKVCDGLKKKEIASWNAYGSDGSCYSASDCAATIRARGETK